MQTLELWIASIGMIYAAGCGGAVSPPTDDARDVPATPTAEAAHASVAPPALAPAVDGKKIAYAPIFTGAYRSAGHCELEPTPGPHDTLRLEANDGGNLLTLTLPIDVAANKAYALTPAPGTPSGVDGLVPQVVTADGAVALWVYSPSVFIPFDHHDVVGATVTFVAVPEELGQPLGARLLVRFADDRSLEVTLTSTLAWDAGCGHP